MTLQVPIPSAIIGIGQAGSTESTPVASGILTEPGVLTYMILHLHITNCPCISHRTAPATIRDGDSKRDVVAGDKDLTLLADMKQSLLGTVPAGLILPTDRPRSHEGPFVGALFSVPLKDPIKSQLQSLAHDLQSDMPTTALVAWIAALSRLTGQDTISLGVGGSVKTRNTIGPSALVVDLSGKPDISGLFARVKQSLESSGDNPIPFSQVSFFAHADGPARPLSNGVSMNCFLELQVVQGSDNVDLNIVYCSDLYNEKTIERYAGYLNAVLVNMKVEKAPDAIAIIHGQKKRAYLELNSLANCLAREISEAGVVPGEHVALLLERSIELVVTELAVLKAGAAYVPLDTTAPADRQAFVVMDTHSKLLITGVGTHVPHQILAPVLRFKTDEKDIGYELNANETHRPSRGSSQDTACVKYTSGTTGVPKGVVTPHCSITSTVINNGCTEIGQEDCVAMAINPAFILSTFDLWLALLNGARVVIIDEETRLNPIRLAETLVRYQVTYMFITAPLLVQYAPTIGKTLSSLKYLVSGGEQVQIKAFSAVQHDGPVRLINRYGSTEVTSGALYMAAHTVRQLDRLPIGRPSSNRRAYVLDQYSNPVPIGAVGDLYIGGPGLATEYLNHPDLTAEKFLPDPFSDIKGARMFKSGDLARYLPDDNLMCAGRTDDLVKIRAYRVELGEIQSRLVGHSLVRNAVVIAVGKESEKRLVAYIDADHHEELEDSLREYLSHMLPEYMIPAVFVRMDVLPLTSRGKVDRRALPEPDFSPSAARDYAGPQGEMEVALAKMWSELFKISRISRHDDFFKLGGHSSMAMRLLNAVATTLGPQLPMSTFFAYSSLQGLAEAIAANITPGGTSAVDIPRVLRESLQDLSFAQQRLWVVAKIAPATDNYHTHQAFRLRGYLDYAALRKAMDIVYARHGAIRSVFPTVDGEAKVRIVPSDAGMPFATLDLRQEQLRESVANQASIQEVRAPFDTEQRPLVRVKLIQLPEEEYILIITIHHIITDGWSMTVLIRELNVLYKAYSAGLPDPLAPLSIQYGDYAAWQRQQLTQDKLQNQVEYWRENLAGAPVAIELPTNRPRPTLQSFAGASVPIHFDSKLTHNLKTLSEKQGVTMFTTVLAGWSTVLSRLSGQDDIIIGTPSANRGHQQVENLIGFF
ncbi:hypothetical protein BG004_008429, partial [Podila humilis]